MSDLRPVSILLSLTTVLLLASTYAGAQHDCVPYEPSTAQGSFDNTWSVPNEQDIYQFTVPSDPGGGYVTVTFSTIAPASPWLTLLVSGPPGSISSGGTNPAGEQDITVVFEVAPSQTYQVEVTEFLNAPVDDHPVPYQLSWSYTGRADCYEPNDGRDIWPDPQSSAKEIPLETVIEAYALAGHIDNYVIVTDDNNYDWYDFTLNAPTEISVGTLQVPSDQKMRLRVFNEAGSMVMATDNPDLGGTVQAGPTLLAEGTYYLEAAPFDRGSSAVRPTAGQAIPDHFNTPYQLVVTAEPLDPCGFQVVFCDDFETGNTDFWDLISP
ncbi:MAG: hypothetical protein ABFS37_03755 [Acidobacteriota bacterium]